jgi:hypothetical protein
MRRKVHKFSVQVWFIGNKKRHPYYRMALLISKSGLISFYILKKYRDMRYFRQPHGLHVSIRPTY